MGRVLLQTQPPVFFDFFPNRVMIAPVNFREE